MIDPAIRWRDDYYFDRIAAYNAVCFFENEIVHIKGPLAGKPLKLEGWQRRFIRRLYGWKRRIDHTRKFRVAFVFVPRKNGKSLLGAGIALYGLVADGITIHHPDGSLEFQPELGAEVVSAAVDREQARVVFDVAVKMVEMNPRLQQMCKIYSKAIICEDTASKYTVLSADVENKHGQNSSTIVFDELHTQPNGNLVEVLKTGTIARAQPLQVYFTTAGHDKNSVCYEYYQKAKEILDPTSPRRDPSFFPIVFEAQVDKKDPDFWKSREIWKQANPNLGISVPWSNFEEAFNEALENGRNENSFKRLHLNIWTETLERWLQMDQWERCGLSTFDPTIHKRNPCILGIDLSRKVDITALVLLFQTPEGFIDVLPYFWLPEEQMKLRSDKDGVPYLEWVSKGYIKTTPGAVVDFRRIRSFINELGEQFKIQEICYDPWAATELATDLEDDGFTMVEIQQSMSKLSGPSKELEALLASTRLRHNNNPVLRWMAGNVGIIEDAKGNIMPSKEKSKERIDGISALLNGLGRLLVLRPKKESRYEREGLFSV
jgi:phage terminase large subunit-like protein